MAHDKKHRFAYTEEDKFFMAMAAGCQMRVRQVNPRICRIETMRPCGIYHDGRRWVVVERVNG